MKTKRSLRVSGFNDYVAVDMVDETGNIISTPIYLKPNESIVVKNLNEDLKIWVKTRITFNAERKRIDCEDVDDSEFNTDFGLLFDVSFQDLLDENQFRY